MRRVSPILSALFYISPCVLDGLVDVLLRAEQVFMNQCWQDPRMQAIAQGDGSQSPSPIKHRKFDLNSLGSDSRGNPVLRCTTCTWVCKFCPHCGTESRVDSFYLFVCIHISMLFSPRLLSF